MARKVTKRQAAVKNGYRSGLEEVVDSTLKQRNIDGEYEKHKIKYTIPATDHTYTPDFRLPNGIFVETKGRFVVEDRKKHVLIKKQHPELDIRFVFQNSKNKIRKGSPTTYADWCIKHGFIYADKTIPQEWLDL
ncbi:endonuclease I [uncultured Caudovirales phage]|uniref:Endonuclease I n=1 Tax=uncultured Caudovirales phage TaxID=2100421 RepID=A0A6J5MBC8_9CAUD|nr:endonuclease I [uncultured Caudovirales phage]